MICASLGHNSIECQGAQGEAAAAFSQMLEAQRAYQDCLKNNPEPTPRLLGITGYVTFLLINEPGGGYGGGSTNWLDADVIFKLHSRPDKGFGFQLRQDAAEPVRRGMLSLLEDAIVNKLQVITALHRTAVASEQQFVRHPGCAHPDASRLPVAARTCQRGDELAAC